MAVWICDACEHGDPCRADGGDGAGDPLYCPWCRTAFASWTEEADE